MIFKSKRFYIMDKPIEDALTFYTKSIPYLDIAIIASSKTNNTLFCTDNYQDVISSLFYHSFELFLKFAILHKCKNKNDFLKTLQNFTHDIHPLYKQYKSLYPTEVFDIDHPFGFTAENYTPCKLNTDEKKCFKKHIQEYDPKYLNLNFRYPFDKKGNFTNGAYGFIFTEEYLKEFKRKLNAIFDKV